MWATGRRVVLVNWAARKIANWDVPHAEYNSPEEARVAVRAWLDEVVNRVQIVEGHYEDVTRLRVGGRTDIWGSLFQVCLPIECFGRTFNVFVGLVVGRCL